MTKPLLRWGILSTAQIARKNWQAIQLSGNGIVSAVASRDLKRSQQFIAECQAAAPFAKAPRALGSYEELIAATDIDAVYIPLPTGLRKEWVIRAAEAGKHILCEKPCSTNLADLTEMFEACRRHRVQFLDGVMFMHTERLRQMREVLDDGKTVGPIKRITSAFTFHTPPDFYTSNIRVRSGLEPAGTLGDQGWYCLRFALWAMNWKLPQQVSGRILSAITQPGESMPVPTEFSGDLFFEGGVSCSFYCSFQTELQQWGRISGTHGYLQIADFVLPFMGSETAFETGAMDYKFVGCSATMERTTRRWVVPEHSDGHANSQETNLFRNFTNQVQSGSVEESWFEIAYKTQQVLQACLESAQAGGKIVPIAG